MSKSSKKSAKDAGSIDNIDTSKKREHTKDSEALNQLSNVAQVAQSRNLFDRLKSWSRSQLLAPFTAGAGCCARELMRLEGPNPQSHLIREKFNHERVDRCDVLIVSGVINEALAPYLKRVYDKMLSPKYCVAVGTCAATGAIFGNIPVSDVIPVDVYIPGCPPSMEALVEGIERLRNQVSQGVITGHDHSEEVSL